MEKLASNWFIPLSLPPLASRGYCSLTRLPQHQSAPSQGLRNWGLESWKVWFLQVLSGMLDLLGSKSVGRSVLFGSGLPAVRGSPGPWTDGPQLPFRQSLGPFLAPMSRAFQARGSSVRLVGPTPTGPCCRLHWHRVLRVRYGDRRWVTVLYLPGVDSVEELQARLCGERSCRLKGRHVGGSASGREGKPGRSGAENGGLRAFAEPGQRAPPPATTVVGKDIRRTG